MLNMYAHDLNYDTYYLAHHGIKGQRWGIRRYQNPDGSLTDKGRRKYGSDDYREVNQLKKKKTKELSNDELRKIAERKDLERRVKKGDEATKRMMVEAGTKLLSTAITVGAVALGTQYIVKHLPDMASAVASSTSRAAIDATKSVGKELYKEGHNIRKNVAQSKGARNYVKAVNKIIGKKRR